MTDPIPLLLSIALIVLIVLMILIGWQLYAILIQVRSSAESVNRMLSRLDHTSETIESSLSQMSGFLSGFRSISSIINRFKLSNKEE